MDQKLNNKIIWVNGIEEKKLSVLDRGLSYGHGVFETILFHSGKLHLLDFHFQRLARGLALLGIDDGFSLIQKEVDQFIITHSDLPDGLIKIIVTAGESEGGYAWPKSMQSTRIILWSSYDKNKIAGLKSQGADLLLSSVRLAHQPLLAGIKHLNRLEQVLIRREVELHQCDEALVLDCNDHVIESNSANIFIVQRGKVITPLLTLCGIAGVMRRYLLEISLPALGFLAEEKNITLDDLYQAEEIFLTNSLWGVVPVRSIVISRPSLGYLRRGIQNWPVGPITQKIMRFNL